MASVTFRKGSKHWYAEYRDPHTQNGERKRKVTKLHVKVEGTPPASLKERGDDAFERSRRRAEKALDDFMAKLEQRRTSDQLAQEIYRAKVGEEYQDVPIDDLLARWKKLPHTRDRQEKQERACEKGIQRFVGWLKERNQQKETSIRHVSGITASVAREYLDSLNEAGLSPRTVKFHLYLLRGLFEKLAPEIGMTRNPFGKDITPAPQESGNVIHRKPFNAQEMHTIIEKARLFPEIRPLVICATCTGMRVGDCAKLKWENIDLFENFITVKTAKTGETVDIPIFDQLREEIMAAQGHDDIFVWPEIAETYQKNPSGLTYRLRKLLAEAGFDCSGDGQASVFSRAHTNEEFNTIRQTVEEQIPPSKRRERMISCFAEYATGKTIQEVSQNTGFSKGCVSGYLNDIQKVTDLPVIRGRRYRNQQTTRSVQQDREKGLRRASVRDWHSFRVTWITLALASGIPMEIVTKITGHQTVDVVNRHYWRPQREQIRQAFSEKMPRLLCAGMASRTDRAIELLRGMTSENWESTREQVLEILAGE